MKFFKVPKSAWLAILIVGILLILACLPFSFVHPVAAAVVAALTLAFLIVYRICWGRQNPELIKPNLKVRGIILIVFPFVVLTAILSLYAILMFTLQTMFGAVPDNSDVRMVIANIIKVIFGFLGVLDVCALPVLVTIGIMMICKSNKHIESFDARSGQGKNSQVPEEIRGWSWGAAGLNWIWGVYHNVWITLLAFIPVFNWFTWIWFGLKGNAWAWRKTKWESVEAFKASQRKWMPWGLGLFIFMMIGLVMNLFFGIMALSFSAIYHEQQKELVQKNLTYLVSEEDPNKYCNCEDMDSQGYAKTIVKQEVTDLAKSGLDLEGLVYNTLNYSLADYCWQHFGESTVKIGNGSVIISGISGTAGVSIRLCSCKPQAEVNLLCLPGITKVIWK